MNRCYPPLRCLVDAGVAVLLLIIAAPLILLCAVLIVSRMGRPVLLAQNRPGLHARIFRLFKFRTMTDARDGSGALLPDARRVTPLGRLLRATSLDELPQLWNVIRGDMSLVGPRPLLPDYLPRYNAHQRRRHQVKPGITGWAQINGRNNLSWEEKLDLDVWYVDHRSFRLDLKILRLTFPRVLQRAGISRDGHATTSEFMGSPSPAEGSGASAEEAAG